MLLRAAQRGSGRSGEPQLRWWVPYAYGGLQFPLATIGLPLMIYVAPFYGSERGIPLGVLGGIMFLTRFLDTLSDPIIGISSDRWRPSIGRRRVWIPIGAGTLSLGAWLLFNPGKNAGVAHFVFALWLTYLGTTGTRLPFQAWGGELSDKYERRTAIASVRQAFGLAGLVFATAVPAVILARPGATSGDVLAAMSIAVIAGLAIFGALLFFLVPEPEPGPRAAKFALRKTAQQLWRNAPFKRLLLVIAIGSAAESARITITLFFARDAIGVSNVGSVYIPYFAAGLCGVPAWRALGNRLGKHRALALSFLIGVGTNAAIFFVPHGETAVFIGLFMVKGFCFGALEMLPLAMLADCADVDTAISGERRQGLILAVSGLALNLGQAAGQAASLGLLGAVGYRSAGESLPDPLLWLRLCHCVLPSALALIAAWLVWRYPLTAERHRRLMASLRPK